MRFTFRDFQKIVQHGLVGMTMTNAREDPNEKKKLETWLEELCTETMRHVQDIGRKKAPTS